MGFIGLNIPDFKAAFTPCVEVGARLAYEYWRKGYALEGANAALKIGFEDFGLQEIVGFTSTVNYRSIAGMEKLGMKRDLNGDFDHPKLSADHKLLKHLLYRISREEFYSK